MRRLAVLSSAFGISACGLTVTGREFVVNAFGGNSEDHEHFPPIRSETPYSPFPSHDSSPQQHGGQCSTVLSFFFDNPFIGIRSHQK